MKNFLLILASTIISFSVSGQIHSGQVSESSVIKKHDVNTTYFILGTLSDYMGRFYAVNKNNQIDRYSTDEKPLIDYIDKIAPRKYKITATLNQTNRYETFSKELSQTLNSFYGTDGMLKQSAFKTTEEVCSYLMGRYYRYGEQLNDSIFIIHLRNSPDHKICDSLLRQTGCPKIHFKYLKNIPAQFIYYFVPSPGLKRYLTYISKQKAELDESVNEYMVTLIKTTREEYDRIRTDRNANDLSEILEIFKNK